MRKLMIAMCASALLVLCVVTFTTAGEKSGKAAAQIGAPAPQFALQDQNGKTVNLSDYSGKVVALLMLTEPLGGATVWALLVMTFLAAGNSAYVRGIGSAPEESWYVYRRGVPLVDADSNQTLAYEAIYLGTARLDRPGDPSTVVLTSAVQEVGAGDKLVAAGRPQPISYAPHAPSKPIRGRVISIYGGLGGVGEAGPQAIISFNRGARDGIEVGHVVAIYSLGGSVRDVSKASGSSESSIKLPDERAGLAFVFRVFNRVSYALVMKVSRPVSPLDVVQNP